MNRIHIVSNRLPVSINVEDDQIELVPSIGGLSHWHEIGLSRSIKANGLVGQGYLAMI